MSQGAESASGASSGVADALERLLALEEIRALQAAYWHVLDGKEWDEMAGLFAPDAVMDFPGDRGGRTRGAGNCVAFIRERVGAAVTVHHGHTPQITFESPDLARGRWAMEDLIRWPEDAPLRGVRALHGRGHYHNTYVRSGGRWWISRTSVTRLRVDLTNLDGELVREI